MSLPTAHAHTHSYSKSTLHNTDVVYMEMCLYILKPVHSQCAAATADIHPGALFHINVCYTKDKPWPVIARVFFHYEQ